MTVYYQCNMKPIAHVLAYLASVILCTAIVYIFYHLFGLSLFIGALLAIYLERVIANATINRRQRQLRLQFRTFLESMSVACRAGRSELHALESALEDLRISYRVDSDIVRELENILLQYKNAGIPLKVLFGDLADRSDLEDIRNFATIYAVIEGRNDRIGDILTQTSEIIGEKIAIEQEIETTIASAKSETNTMLIMPIIIVLALSTMGGELMSSLFETMSGHLSATAALIIFAISYVLAVKASNIDV